MRYSSLLVVYLESLNCSPRALISAFSVTTEAAMKDKQTLATMLQFGRDIYLDRDTHQIQTQ